MRNRSYTTNLSECAYDWIVGLGSSNNIVAVYIELV